MKLALNININAPEDTHGDNDGDNDSNPDIYKHINWCSIERVLEKELTDLFPDSEKYDSAEISVTFVSPEEICDLNHEYRECEEPTDVLSFPLWQSGEIFVGPLLALGDIVICPEEVARLHPELGRDEALCLMIAHSFLHLLGWDHDTEEKQQAMWERQDIIKNNMIEALNPERQEEF